MTRNELRSELYYLVKDWHKVDKIFMLFGKLAPEPPPKKEVPQYDLKLVRRVGTLLQREKFSPELHEAARALLANLELDLE